MTNEHTNPIRNAAVGPIAKLRGPDGENALRLEPGERADEAISKVIARTTADLPLFSVGRFRASTALTPAGNDSFVYWRYSTDRQEETSEERQIAACEGYVLKLRSSVVEVFGDRGKSGVGMAHRAGLQKLRAEAKRLRPKRVVVEDLDRLSRRLSDLLLLHTELTLLGIELHDVTHGRLDLVHVMIRGYMGEEGRVRFLGLGKAGRRQAVAKGRLMHLVAYGYRRHPEEGHVHLKDEATSAIVVEIFTMIASGMSVHAVTRELSRRGVPPPAQARIERRGGKVAKLKPWNNPAVSSIVRSYLYIGFVCWGMTETVRDSITNDVVRREPSSHGQQVVIEMPELALVDRDLWTRANLRLGESSWGSGAAARRYLFTGKAFCALCGGGLAGGIASGGIPRYFCSTRQRFGAERCAAVSAVRIDYLERAVLSRLFEETWSDESIERYLARLRAEIPRLVEADERRRRELLRRMVRIDDIIARSYEDESAGIVSARRAQAQRKGQSEEAEVLERELGRLKHATQYLAGIDAIESLQQAYERVLGEVPFRPADPAGIALAQSLRDVVASIVVRQPDAAGETRIVIEVDPLLQMRGVDGTVSGLEGAPGTITLEASFNTRDLWRSKVKARADALFDRTKAALRDGRHAVSDREWGTAAPFFAAAGYRIDGRDAGRRLLDGMVCMAAEGGPFNRVVDLFGDAGEFKRAVARIIYSRRWDDAVVALADMGSPCVAHLAYFDATGFLRRQEKTERPDAEQAALDRAELLTAAAGRAESDRTRLRCELVAAVLGGATIAGAARRVGTTARMGYFYWDTYLQGGVDRLAPKVVPPSKQRLSDAQVGRLKTIAELGVDPGRPAKPLTCKVICRLSREMFDVDYSEQGMRILLRRNKFDLTGYQVRARREGRLSIALGPGKPVVRFNGHAGGDRLTVRTYGEIMKPAPTRPGPAVST